MPRLIFESLRLGLLALLQLADDAFASSTTQYARLAPSHAAECLKEFANTALRVALRGPCAR
jgi:hypothetical protein